MLVAPANSYADMHLLLYQESWIRGKTRHYRLLLMCPNVTCMHPLNVMVTIYSAELIKYGMLYDFARGRVDPPTNDVYTSHPYKEASSITGTFVSI